MLVPDNGSPQRSMVDGLTVVFPYAVTLDTATAFTLTNTTTSTSVPLTCSNPSGDQRIHLLTFTGDRTWLFHRLFGDTDNNGTVNALDYAKFSRPSAAPSPSRASARASRTKRSWKPGSRSTPGGRIFSATSRSSPRCRAL